MPESQSFAVLIADDDPMLRELMRISVEKVLHARIIEVDSGSRAIALLHADPSIVMVVSDYNMPDGTGGDLYRYVIESRRDVHFILVSSDELTSHPEFEDPPPFGFAKKPRFGNALRDLLVQALEQGLIPRGVQPTKPTFVQISFRSLERLDRAPSDLYLHLGPDHYVKIFKQSDVLSAAELFHYSEKGIAHFHVRSEELGSLIEVLEKTILSLSTEGSVPPSEILQKDMVGSIELVHEFARVFGWDERLQRMVSQQVNTVVRNINKIPELSPFLQNLLTMEKSGLGQYCASVAYVNCGVIQSIGWASDFAYFKMTLAAMVQDMTLNDDQIEELLNPGKKGHTRGFLEHPRVAAGALSKWKDTPPDVQAVIEQHHESPNGAGFPKGLPAARISPLAAVMIVSRDLVEYYRVLGPKALAKNFFQDRKELYSQGAFKKVAAGLSGMIS